MQFIIQDIGDLEIEPGGGGGGGGRAGGRTLMFHNIMKRCINRPSCPTFSLFISTIATTSKCRS